VVEQGFRFFHDVGRCATVFGSARFPVGRPYYELAREAGEQDAGERAVGVRGC